MFNKKFADNNLWILTGGTEEWSIDIPICASNHEKFYDYIIYHLDDADIIDFFLMFARPNGDHIEGNLEDIENELLRLLMGFYSKYGVTYNFLLPHY